MSEEELEFIKVSAFFDQTDARLFNFWKDMKTEEEDAVYEVLQNLKNGSEAERSAALFLNFSLVMFRQRQLQQRFDEKVL